MFKPTLISALTATIVVAGAPATFAQEASDAPDFDNFVSTKTRAEVVAETKLAARRGLIPRNESDIQRLLTPGFQSTKSRAQVRAETIEAIRLGLITNGETATPQATPEQLEQIRIAGLRTLYAQPIVARK